MEPTRQTAAPEQNGGGVKKKLVWSVLSLLIAAASIWAVASQMKAESLAGVWEQLSRANPIFTAAAVACMLGFILFEALAVRAACTAFGEKPKLGKSWNWVAADIYFSAITPSATGGQPACALLMMQDGIHGTAATAALLLNLTMYTCSILVIGLGCFILRPSLYWNFGPVGRVLVAVGYLVQIGLSLFFFLLVRHAKLLRSICTAAVRLGARLHLVRSEQKVLHKLTEKIEDYQVFTSQLLGQRRVLLKVFLYNLLQRISQILVTMFMFLALGMGGAGALDMLALQSYVVLGSNYVPVPGGMGVTDYLMLDAFDSFMTFEDAAGLELISRSLSFYLCILLCGGALVVRGLIRKKRKVRN